MKKAIAAMCLSFAFCFCASSMAAEKKSMDPPADGSTITIVGMMAVKAPDAKSDVICRLTTGKNKNDKLYNLVASGDIAKQIQALREEGDKVKVVGKVSGDDLAVQSIEKLVYMKK